MPPTRIAAPASPKKSIEDQLDAAMDMLQNNIDEAQAFRAIASPTNAQVSAYVRNAAQAHIRAATALRRVIRLLRKNFNGTD